MITSENKNKNSKKESLLYDIIAKKELKVFLRSFELIVQNLSY